MVSGKLVKSVVISREQSIKQVKISVVCSNLSSRKQTPKFSLVYSPEIFKNYNN